MSAFGRYSLKVIVIGKTVILLYKEIIP